MDVGAVSQGISGWLVVMGPFNAWYKGFENAMMPMDITAMTAMPMALLVEEVIVFLLIVSLLRN